MPAIRSVIEVDPSRRAQWLMPSAVRYVNPRHIRYLLRSDPDGTWSQGDLLLVEVEGPVGLISTVQNTNRRSNLNYRDAERQPLNTRRFALPLPDERRAAMPGDPALILVAGSDMDSGKTTTARRVIYSLRAMGHPVVAGKASGVGSLFDIASMFDAGASEVIDFVALGEPVTIGLPAETVLAIFHRLFSYLRGKVGPDGSPCWGAGATATSCARSPASWAAAAFCVMQ